MARRRRSRRGGSGRRPVARRRSPTGGGWVEVLKLLFGGPIRIFVAFCIFMVLVVWVRMPSVKEDAARYRRELQEQENSPKHRRKMKERRERESELAEERKKREARDWKYGSELDALIFAQRCVKAGLANPSTADFGWRMPATFAEDWVDDYLEKAPGWMITGTVEAKNDFNLELDHNWTVKCRKRNGKWEVIDMSIRKRQ